MKACVSTGMICVVGVVTWLGCWESQASDCNQNGVEDARDLQSLLDAQASSVAIEMVYTIQLLTQDLDGDGDLDLLAVGLKDWEMMAVAVAMKGDGATFEPAAFSAPTASSSDVGYGGRPRTVATAADVDGDSDIDVAAILSGGQLVVLRNNGTGGFGDTSNYDIPGLVPETSGAPSACDLDGDGDQDLVWIVQADEGDLDVVLLVNDGAGNFSWPPDILAQASYLTPMALDLNADGALDLVVQTGAPTAVFLGRGDGSFGSPARYGDGACGLSAWAPEALTAADLDGDGDIDLARGITRWCEELGTSRSFIGILSNDAEGSFEESFQEMPDFHGFYALTTADLDADGNVDLIASGAWRGSSATDGGENDNSIPDECETPFHRGDPNYSGTTDISDGIAIFDYLFLGAEPLTCLESADANNDGTIDISDGIYLLNWLFVGGAEPAAPGPPGAPCGFDPDPPGSQGDLGCEAYSCK